MKLKKNLIYFLFYLIFINSIQYINYNKILMICLSHRINKFDILDDADC